MAAGFVPMGQPHVVIVEQPAGKALRFRYECEGRSAGSIPGCNSTPERKTYPTIEIRGYRGPAIVLVSCVTKDEPYKPHPHKLVGRERCENGVCTLKTNITDDNSQVSFSNLGIQCVKRKEIAEALSKREDLRVDPFKTGYAHRNQLQSIDLNAVRLCFQVFIIDHTGKHRRSLPPVVSDVIYDKKAMSDLHITRISHCSASPKGGTEVILLCERITKEDISVRFFERDGDRVVWDRMAHVVMVHRQYAVVFQTPPYQRPDISSNVQVYLQLVRTSDNTRSDEVAFEFTPDMNSDASHISRKRQKTISSVLHQYDTNRNFQDQKIKAEPSNTPPHMIYSPPNDNMWSPAPGPSHHAYLQEPTWGNAPTYAAMNYSPVSPNLQSPMHQGHQTMPASMQTLSPHNNMMLNAMDRISPHGSPNVGHVSPGLGHASPGLGHVSPALGHVSPALGHASPVMRLTSPGMGHASPVMDPVPPMAIEHISPHLIHPAEQPMEMTVPSLNGLLEEAGDFQLNSGDLSSMAAFLASGQQPDLTDGINKLSTRDLLHD